MKHTKLKEERCKVCATPIPVSKPEVFCAPCFTSGTHMAQSLERGITLEYQDGTQETIRASHRTKRLL